MVIYLFVILSEHLTNFEMNTMSMEHPKRLLNNVTNVFLLQKKLLKKCEMIWKWHFHGKVFMHTFTL